MTEVETVEVLWHSRQYLPHYEGREVVQMITFRLADALPKDVAEKLAIIADSPEQRKQIEGYLDAGHGACWLAQPDVAKVCADTFLKGNRIQYELHAWGIMPNHVHVLIQILPPHSLGDVVKTWKAVVARYVNEKMNRFGPVWQREYWDRWVRDAAHYANAVNYIRNNPIKAGLSPVFACWPWSPPGSAGALTGESCTK